MSRSVRTDDQGRVVIPADMREKHGDEYRIVERPDRIELIPLEPSSTE